MWWAKYVLRTIAVLNSCPFAGLGPCDQTLRHDQCPSRQQARSVLSIASISILTAYARDRSTHEANEAHPGMIEGCVPVCSRLCMHVISLKI